MWYPAQLVSMAAEPVTIPEARLQCNLTEPDFDGTLAMLISAARAHAEEYCNARFAAQTLTVACTAWSDLAALSEAPVVAIESITYTDAAGVDQTLAASVYRVNADGLSPSIALKAGQVWPAISAESRITLRGTFGGVTSPAVKHAMLQYIGNGFEHREIEARPLWTSFDALLCNHRRGASW